MDDSFCLGTLNSVSVHMRHYIMTDFLFPCFCHIIIDVLCMGFHLIDLLLGNMKPQFFLCLCKCDPQLSPGTELHIL